MPQDRPVHPAAEAVFRYALLPYVRLLWRPRLLDTDHFPTGPCFVYGNHSNNYDPFTFNMFTPFGDSTVGVMTMEQFRGGVVAKLMRGIGLQGTRKWVPEPRLIRHIYRMLDQDRMVFVYPEGGRRWDGRPSPWIESTAKLFVRAGVPVYPVLTHGSYVGQPRWARFPRPARLQVEVRPPLQFDRRTPFDEALRQLKAPIAIDETRVPDAIKPRWAYRPADGVHRLLYRDPETGTPNAVYTPDGTTLRSTASDLQLTMLPDSTLRDDRTGAVHTTAELYDRVRAHPLEPDADGVLLRHRVEVYEEVSFPELVPRGPAEARLRDDAVMLRLAGETLSVPLETVRYIGVERNYKLELSQADRMLQLRFEHDGPEGGSVLQWADALERLGVGQHTTARAAASEAS